MGGFPGQMGGQLQVPTDSLITISTRAGPLTCLCVVCVVLCCGF